MILHKQNTMDYQPFLKLIDEISPDGESTSELSMFRYNNTVSDNHLLEKYSHMLQNLVSFEKSTDEIKNPVELISKLKQAVKRVIPIKDSALLFFDESFARLNPVQGSGHSEIIEMINNYYKEGVLHLLFETGKVMIVPELNSWNSDNPKMNFVLFPLIEDGRKKGLFALLSTIEQNNFSELDKQIIKILLNVSLSKIDKYNTTARLFSTYEELQTYQAKLSNDFRLSAIGELTEGIIEDIMSPLQVIMSQVDLMEDNSNTLETKAIKTQIHKVNSVINRLVKFANINQKNVKIIPIKLNEIITQYYGLVKSTLNNLDLECVLDYEEDLPSILSHPNYIFQILTNAIGLIKNQKGKSGGMIIQTRMKNDQIILRVITTLNLKTFSSAVKKDSDNADLNVRIINNLMSKHEGEFIVQSLEKGGSVISLKFPLRRKLR